MLCVVLTPLLPSLRQVSCKMEISALGGLGATPWWETEISNTMASVSPESLEFWVLLNRTSTLDTESARWEEIAKTRLQQYGASNFSSDQTALVREEVPQNKTLSAEHSFPYPWLALVTSSTYVVPPYDTLPPWTICMPTCLAPPPLLARRGFSPCTAAEG